MKNLHRHDQTKADKRTLPEVLYGLIFAASAQDLVDLDEMLQAQRDCGSHRARSVKIEHPKRRKSR